mmetsp:Transcript_16330/g.28607  ORF Transcript_16330/g.28607 Transcript_16330/m.28607 type:complete len:498 (-) Transcript_16330:66-1559(-)
MAVLDLAPFNNILSRLEGVADRLERGAALAPQPAATANGPCGAAAADDPAIVVAFDAFKQGKLPGIEAAAKDIGQDVIEATEVVVSGTRFLRELLLATSICKKPQDADWTKILGPVMELGQKAQKACDQRSEFFQNRKACAEAINMIMLVTSPSPPAHVQNVLETFDFHAIKVMQKKNEKETAWIKAVKEMLKELKDWCNENCKLGVTWNAQGKDAVEYFSASPLGSGAGGGAAAPAPGGKAKGKGKGPAMPKGGLAAPSEEVKAKLREGAPAKPAAAAGMSAVFNAIREVDTGNLKKVTSDMKTKNQPKDLPKVQPAAAPKAAAPAPGRNRKGPRGAPLKELQKDTNWVLENYENEQIVMDEATMQQLVVIINCRNTTVQVKGKVKSICVDGCEKVNVICNDVISAVEMVNSDRCQLQTLGKIVAVAIDKCDGANVFLSKDSLEAEITSSKSSEMNVTIPDPDGEDGDIIEMPIPEQFVTKLVGKKLKTEVSGIYA